jgi:hypothetical protein
VSKTDKWFELDGELFIEEVVISFGTKPRYNIHLNNDEEEEVFEELSTLEVRKMVKERKYGKLVENCEHVF